VGDRQKTTLSHSTLMSEQPDSCPKCGTPGGPKEFGLQPCTCGWFDYEEAERRRKTAALRTGRENGCLDENNCVEGVPVGDLITRTSLYGFRS